MDDKNLKEISFSALTCKCGQIYAHSKFEICGLISTLEYSPTLTTHWLTDFIYDTIFISSLTQTLASSIFMIIIIISLFLKEYMEEVLNSISLLSS